MTPFQNISSPARQGVPFRESKGFPFAIFALVFFIILGARLTMMHLYAMDLPYWDQWDAEAKALFIPFADGTLKPEALFSVFAAHRIFFTRVTNLGIWLVNGQWDGLPEMVAGTFVYLAYTMSVFYVLWRLMNRRYVVVLAYSIIMMGALPFGWQNTLWGFQSQKFFCMAFSFAALYLMINHRPFGGYWWWGVGFALAALLTFGSGTFGALAVGVAMAVKAMWERLDRRASVLTAGAGLAIAMVGVFIQQSTVRVTDVYWRNTLLFFSKCLSWPFVDQPWMAIVVWVPAFLFILLYLMGRIANTRLGVFVVGLVAWYVLVVVALVTASIMRGLQLGTGPGSSYMDDLAICIPLNTAAALALYDQYRTRLPSWGVLGVYLWSALLGYGAFNVTFGDFGNFRSKWFTGDFARQQDNIRNFVRTDDPVYIPEFDPALHWNRPIPFWSSEELIKILRHAAIRNTLPLSVRRSVPLLPESGAKSNFVKDRYDPRGPSRTDHLPVWSSWGVNPPSRFVSRPCQPDKLTYLVFEYTGFPNRGKGVGLRLEAVDGTWTQDITPDIAAWREWRRWVVRQPLTPYRVVAYDDFIGDNNDWLAFTEPRGWGRLSRWADWLIKSGKYFLFISLSALLALLIMAASWTVDQGNRHPA